MIVTRFAPSPNGHLHLGHAFSAVIAHDLAREAGGEFLLRIEDIDGARSRGDLAREFREDLNWLGLEYREVTPQSGRLASYEEAARRLRNMGLIYPCICTRKQIAAAAHAQGPEGPIYPETCKHRAIDLSKPHAWRLDMAAAIKQAGKLEWIDALAGPQIAQPQIFGDTVLLRKDEPASYHLAATLDDAADGVTLVTRGRDLFGATHIHRLLQSLLELPVPIWHHHALLLDGKGHKLAKSRSSRSLAQMRREGANGRSLADNLRAGKFPATISLGKD